MKNMLKVLLGVVACCLVMGQVDAAKLKLKNKVVDTFTSASINVDQYLKVIASGTGYSLVGTSSLEEAADFTAYRVSPASSIYHFSCVFQGCTLYVKKDGSISTDSENNKVSLSQRTESGRLVYKSGGTKIFEEW